ncbi:ubiquitin-like domain-containing CTD phosphatase 1 [Condylostylus longicornis]|uniref:ubiquitin-like domain-containing CTD phosphatase 1 n=1 Tax=Condylostylus longicornis TaxID=2530218 RepID=UPI00244E0140|nr:ubiquitin-like domain-containing CTD phosphatase 1 [Condylostylus longicornis]
MDDVKDVTFIVKWSGKEFPISDLVEQDTVAILKHEIYKKTQVRPERQKLLNLKYKNKLAADDVRLNQLDLKPNFKIMMMGSTEQDIENACSKPDGSEDVVDDFEDNEEKDMPTIENSCIYLNKVQKRIKDYVIKEITPPRKNRHLLVLDIDYTLFDHRSTAETGAELMRPYLHEFLTSAYAYYDIVIWSATGMKWIEEKMKLLGVSANPDYKILFYLDSNAMISIYTTDRGVIDVKPLGVIWGKYPDYYNSKNTIMLDDIRRNFLMNPKSGLRIRPYRQAHLNRDKDSELLKLKKYLLDIAENCDDFNTLNHRNWENYDPGRL